MRHELKSSGEGEGGEGRGKANASYVVRVENCASVAHVAVKPAVRKAAGLCIVIFAVLVAAADVSGCASLSSQCLPTPLMPCCRRSAYRRR